MTVKMRKVRTAIQLLFVLTSWMLLSSMMTSYNLLLESTTSEEGSIPDFFQLTNPTKDEKEVAVKQVGNNDIDFVRYSQRYQTDPDKQTITRKMLEEKQQIITRQRLDAIRSHQRNRPSSQRARDDAFEEQQQQMMFTVKDRQRRTAFTQERRYPKIVYFLHIHKSAGSTFCRQAYANRLMANYQSNCNVQSDQQCCGYEDSLQAQLDFANTTSYDVVACEQEMYDAMAPERYDYVVSLRDSKRRYYSHWNHLRLSARQHREDKKTGNNRNLTDSGRQQIVETSVVASESGVAVDPTESVESDNQEHYSMTVSDYNGKLYPVGNYTLWWMGQPDNYNVRMICGAKCKYIPKYQLTEELFQYTLTRLSQFAHVFFVEDIQVSFGRVAQAFGWNSTVDSEHRYKHLEPEELTDKVTNQYWDPFMSTLDDALYQFARSKYENGTKWSSTTGMKFANQELLNEYFQTGPNRGCSNPCCGECSKW